MSKGTRYIVFGGGGLLAAGLAIGLAAWLGSGLPTEVLAQGRPDELRYLPADAAVVSFANVREVMDSDLRERLRERESETEGPAAFENRTGIDLDRDIDRVVAALAPGGRTTRKGSSCSRGASTRRGSNRSRSRAAGFGSSMPADH